MKLITRTLAGAATLAMLAATPALAQYRDDDRYRNRDTVEEVVDGVARVAGAVAAVTQGYDPRYGYGQRYGGPERHAADACAYEAQRRYGRYGRAEVDIQAVQWSRRNRLRVHGTLDMGSRWGGHDRYDSRYDSRYGRYDPRYGRYDPRYGRNDPRYGRYGRYDDRSGRVAFSCSVRPDGRVTDFDIDRNRNRYGYYR